MSSNHVLLETIQLSQSAASVTFDNIPQTGYSDLKIVASTRSTKSGGNVWDSLLLRFNSSSTGYSDRAVAGNGTTAFSFTNPFPNYIFCGDIPDQQTTSNTFASTEITIPNYSTSNPKSMSIDNVEENNATTSQLDLVAGLWNDTASITSLVFTLNGGNFVANSTFSLYGVAALGTTPTVAPKATGGNIVANDGTFWYHAFLTSGTFVPQTPLTCDYLVIAGGGSGGSADGAGWGGGGGGGAGGLLTSIGGSPLSLTSINYPVLVGAGGAGVAWLQGANGTNSTISTITATGGGGGGRGSSTAGNRTGSNGGSGGGGGYTGGVGGSASPSGQGFAGGNSTSGNGGGGGGGAGAVGGNATFVNPTHFGGTGGAGYSSASAWATATNTGVSGVYAGGGGGGSNSLGAGGTGGGGSGGNNVGTNPTSAIANTGSGGGGFYDIGAGGNGASGIVIIRYAIV
jgi:hypothetical protein